MDLINGQCFFEIRYLSLFLLLSQTFGKILFEITPIFRGEGPKRKEGWAGLQGGSGT